MTLQARSTPCGSCPYRQDCPSGLWDRTEYKKLPEYDRDTASQSEKVFMCHDARDGTTMCRGWLDTHDKGQLLSLRLAVSFGKLDHTIFDLPVSGVPVFTSGQAACQHGLAQLNSPGAIAQRIAHQIEMKRAREAERNVDAGTQ